MGDEKKSSNASRVLRFTVTSALVMAPLAGCGTTSVEPERPNVNSGPVVEPPRYAPNPGPDEPGAGPTQPLGPQLPTANPGPEPVAEVDAGAPAAVPTAIGANQGPHHTTRSAPVPNSQLGDS